ncbi:MAG: hypothetical protein OXE81_02430 [Gammaproteobacteria bacterium]|nr:hypothetical protein [Gammaproteobacteria bacterium]
MGQDTSITQRVNGVLHLAGAVLLGAVFVYFAVKLLRGGSGRTAMHTFRYSIIYLGALFSVMLGKV